jgi:hypothetical protein
LVEWFLENVSFPDKGYGLIYYTGKRSLVFEKDPPANMFIYKGRPNLAEAISGIIVSVASGEGPPESTNERLATTPNSKTAPEMRAKLLLEKAMSIFTTDQLFSHALEVSNEFFKAMGLEIRTDSVDYCGVRSLMEKLLKENFRFMEDELTEHYELCSSREGLLDQFQFKALLHRMAKSAEENGVSLISERRHYPSKLADEVPQMPGPKFRALPSSAEKRVDSFLCQVADVRNRLEGLKDGKFAAKYWSMLYCGGSQPVLDQLKEYKRKHRIALSVEKFDW